MRRISDDRMAAGRDQRRPETSHTTARAVPDPQDARILGYLHLHGGYHSPDEVAAALDVPAEDVRRRLHVLWGTGLVIPFDTEAERYGLTYQGIEATAQAA